MNRTSTSLILLFFYEISALTLRDQEIASSSTPYYLDNLTWFASETSLGLNISATVPGDIITDLQKSGLISDPWHELNFLDNRSLWDPNLSWTFQTSMIEIPVTNSSSSNSTFLLVFEGVKMGAHVLFNTIELGTVTNQFMRYVFQIPLDSVRQGPMNEIQVRFDSSLQTLNRFCASSGGWDWQAVSQLEVNDTVFGVSPSFSSGIWKSVYILQASPLVITDIVPLVTYLGEYPVTPLTDGSHGGFQVNITAHIVVSEGDYPKGFFSAQSEWGISQNSSIMTLPSGVSNVTLILQAPASLIKLWWPNGLGNHSLYNISVTWTSTSTVTPSITAVRRIGFRTAALVTVNDTNATVVAESKGMNGSGSFGMFFRINGAAIFSRGANLVPTEMLEGRLDAIAYHTLVQSASAAHFNMIRVWGGGIYPPDIFYDMCDSEGILLYHDLMFAGEGHDIASAKQPFSNTTNFTIESEISHQIKRLSHHPSIILYDSANEVIVQRSGPTALYVSLVLAAVVRDDPSRIIWPASPAAGWISGVDRLWGSFNGQPLIPVGTGHIWDAGNERHGTYIAGVGAGNWTTVIRDPWTQDHTFDPGTPLAYLPSPQELTGVEYPSIFASEFGTTSMSSFEAFSASLDESSYGLHGGNKPSNCTIAPSGGFFQNCTGRNAMAQRNWACDNVIWSYFGPNLLNLSGIDAFKGQLFQCLIASAIHMQIDIEQRRAQNYLGAIFWMFQDSWVSGSWGSIEYVTPSINGTTLRGGRWKPMHNWLESHMFQDVMSACGYVGRSKTFVCYVNNARPDTSFQGTLSITAINLINGTENEWETLPVFVKQGPNEILWLTPTTSLPNASTTVLIASLIDVDGNSFDEHIVHLTPPMNLLVQPATLSVDVATVPNLDRSINITVSSDKVALFVTLTSAAPGRFSNNAFLLRPLSSPKIISWIPFEDTDPISDIEILRNTIRIEDLSAYVN